MPTVLKRNKRYQCVYACRRCPIYVSPVDWHTHSAYLQRQTLGTDPFRDLLYTQLNTSRKGRCLLYENGINAIYVYMQTGIHTAPIYNTVR